MEKIIVKKIKKGEYVKRKLEANRVWVRGDYCRSQKKFSLTAFDDHCMEIFVKPTTELFVNFDADCLAKYY